MTTTTPRKKEHPIPTTKQTHTPTHTYQISNPLDKPQSFVPHFLSHRSQTSAGTTTPSSMDSFPPPLPPSQTHLTPDPAAPPEDENQPSQLPSVTSCQPPAVASISLSVSTLLSTAAHVLTKPISSPNFSPFTSNLKIPSQISSLSHLSLSSPSSTKHSAKLSSSSAISAFPLQAPLRHVTRRPSEPTNPAAGRRCTIVWFRNDLRVHDNEALTAASNESLSVLPVYLFDPRDYGKSSSGFDKTGPYRATFLLESVSDLRKSLRAKGSDLVVRIGRPETVLVEMARAVGADAVFAHQEVSHDEVRAEERVGKTMEEEGVEVKYFWGSTLYHIEDLPFDVQQMPSNYGGFRDRVQGLAVRKTIEALDQVKGLPSRGDVEVGEIPTLKELGLNPAPTLDGKPVANASLTGGESEALKRLKTFAGECRAQPNKDSNRDSIYGANFSCKISPWLAMGCLSPRFMFDELKKNVSRTVAASSQKKDGGSDDGRMNWLLFELLWRDFFRFITKKYSNGKKSVAPVPACA